MDNYLRFTLIILTFGVSMSLILSSCGPVSSSVSKLGSESENNTPIQLSNNDRSDKSSKVIELKNYFYPLVISDDDAYKMPTSTLDVSDTDLIKAIKTKGNLELESDLIENADKIFVVFVLDLNKKDTANIELNHFVPFLHKQDEGLYNLVINNHGENGSSVILERQNVEDKVKSSLVEIHFYTEKDLKDEEVIKLVSLKDKTALNKIRRPVTAIIQAEK